MRGWLLGLTLASGCSMVIAQGASAQAIATAKMVMPVRMGTQGLTASDAVFVGRVVGMEPMDVEATPAPGQAKVNYRIAVVQVNETLHGLKKETKTVRVGFVVPAANGIGGGVQIQPLIAAPPGIRPGIRFPGYVNVNLQVGQEGLFMVAKHSKETFFVLPTYQSFVSSQNNPNFAADVNETKNLCKVMGDPGAALKSDDAQQRYLAAALLVGKYRSNLVGTPMKQEPIGAEESKLILKAIAAGDWNTNNFNARVPNPLNLFNQLGINAADGYQLVNIRNQQDITQAMQKWLSDNSDKYVIKKLVADPNAQVGNGINQPDVIQPIAPVPPNGRPLPIKQRPPIRINPGQGQIQILPAQPGQGPIQILPAQPGQIQIQIQPGQIQILPAPLPNVLPAQPPVPQPNRQ